jgi:general secretion pathway protein M
MAQSISSLTSSLQSSFATLSVRERRMVGIGGAVAAAVVVFLVIFTFSSKADAIRSRTQRNALQLQEVLTLADGYREAKATQEAAERQLAQSNVRLISYLEERAKTAGVELGTYTPKADQTLDNPKIVESAVEITLTDVKLNRLTDFLQSIETGPGVVRVKYLRMSPRPQSETVTAWLTVATYHLKT